MLGSRFDLAAKLDDLATRRAAKLPATPDVRSEASSETVSDVHCAELEREVAELARSTRREGQPPSSAPRIAFRCPVCDDFMSLGGESDLTEFHGLDVKLHRLRCDNCGMLAGRVYHPSVGYNARLVR